MNKISSMKWLGKQSSVSFCGTHLPRWVYAHNSLPVPPHLPLTCAAQLEQSLRSSSAWGELQGNKHRTALFKTIKIVLSWQTILKTAWRVRKNGLLTKNRHNKGWLIEWGVIWAEPFSVSRCAVLSKTLGANKNNFFRLLDFLHHETAFLLVNTAENGSSLNASKQNSFSLQTRHNLISEKHSELVEAELYRFHKKHKSELFPTLQTQFKKKKKGLNNSAFDNANAASTTQRKNML